MLVRWIDSCKVATQCNLPLRAFGLPFTQTDDWPDCIEFGDRENPEPALLTRINQACVDVSYVDAIFEDHKFTDQWRLQAPAVELQPKCVSHGTKRSFEIGNTTFSSEYLSQRRKPYLDHLNFCMTGYALSDLTSSLKPRQCIIIQNSKVYKGPVAVWHCPCQLPTDIDVWEALELHLDMPFSRNCVIVSVCGLCTTHLAGGDFNGKTIMCSFDSELIRFLQYTEDLVKPFLPGQATYENIKTVVEEGIADASKDVFNPGLMTLSNQVGDAGDIVRAQSSLDFAVNNVKTPQLRGQICSWYEQLVNICLIHSDYICDDGDNSLPLLFKYNFSFSMLNNKAHDVPKKGLSEHIRKFATILRNAADWPGTIPGSTKVYKYVLKIFYSNFCKKKHMAFNVAEPFISSHLDKVPIVQVYVGNFSTTKLGYAAGNVLGF